MTFRDAVIARVTELARLVGYLALRVEPGSSAWFLVERVGDEVESLDCMFFPSVAELYSEFVAISGDDAVALDEALRAAELRVRLLRTLLRRECDR